MIVLIDNYDSFTYNLFHFLGELGAEVRVERNDALTSDQVLALNRVEAKIVGILCAQAIPKGREICMVG